jgi:hypothetical protein
LLETASAVKQKRDELKAKRNLLFKRFSNNPANTYLALEIKTLDDQVAEVEAQIFEKKLEAKCRLTEERHEAAVLCSSLHGA